MASSSLDTFLLSDKNFGGNKAIGNAQTRVAAPQIRKPIHHAPIQRGSFLLSPGSDFTKISKTVHI